MCAGLENKVYRPTWFQKENDPITGSLLHVFNGKYWDCKSKQQWEGCPDIYLWSALPPQAHFAAHQVPAHVNLTSALPLPMDSLPYPATATVFWLATESCESSLNWPVGWDVCNLAYRAQNGPDGNALMSWDFLRLIDCLKRVGKFICGEITYHAVVALRSGVHAASLCVQQYLIFECVCINSVNGHVLSLPWLVKTRSLHGVLCIIDPSKRLLWLGGFACFCCFFLAGKPKPSAVLTGWRSHLLPAKTAW